MPRKVNPDAHAGYDYQLTDREEQRAQDIELPGEWELAHVTASGFVTFEAVYDDEDRDNGTDTQYRTAAIGPTEAGETRAYLDSERPNTDDPGYDTEERYEGDFDTALDKLTDWLPQY